MKKTAVLLILIITVAFFYIRSAPSAFKYDDSPETISDSMLLSIQHPPGYPLFTLAGKAATLLPLGSAAFRVNFLSILLTLTFIFVTWAILEYTVSGGNFGHKSGNGTVPPGFWGAALTGISYLIWNQGIEAKGGIYILNLMLTAVVIFSSFKISEAAPLKYIYLMFFAFSLSLANQWPSAMVMGPVVLYALIRYRRSINIKRAGVLGLFLIIGLSPYIYLPLRMHTTGSPATWENFWWFVSRSPYLSSFAARPDFLKQAALAAGIIVRDISMLLVFAIPGLIYLSRRNKVFLFISLYVIAANFAAAVAYNAFRTETSFVFSTFLLPAVYMSAVISAAGIYYTLGFLGKKPGMVCAAGTAFAILFVGWANFDRNNLGSDYIAYDYAHNILKTMEDNSVYIPARDINTLPLYYLIPLVDKPAGLKMIVVQSLKIRFVCESLMKSYPGLRLEPGRIEENIIAMVSYFSGKRNIYMVDTGITVDGMVQYGILRSVGSAANVDIFKKYSYRGIYSKAVLADHLLMSIVSRYPGSLKIAAMEAAEKNDNMLAASIYRKAMLFPSGKR